ncbi:MAG TPA: hypothetical protein DCP90_09515 [Clostridiales bacterium]|nr:MAG: hypothetical protein A2Y22_03505 [Clostridiales bacterium GWD2_32_59]HAN10830.1 hypothetical protein [Clostridiales bacterium]
MLNIEKEKVKLKVLPEENVTQIVFEEDIIVPDVKADIGNIIQVDSQVHIKSFSFNLNKLNYDGCIEYNILYVSDEQEKTINSIIGEIKINDTLNMENIRHEDLTIEAEIEYFKHLVINSRKLNLKVVINMKIKSEKNIEKDIITSENDFEYQTLYEDIDFDVKSDSKSEKVFIKETIELPLNKPNVKDILKCSMSLKNIDFKPIDEKVVLKGNLSILVVYNNYENSVELIEYDIDISQTIDNVNCDESMIVDGKMDIQDKYIEVSSDENGDERIISIEMVAEAKFEIIAEEKKTVLKDIYGITKKIKPQKEIYNYDKIVFKNKNKSTIKDTFSIDKSDVILQVYSIDGKIKTDNITVKKDAIVLEGHIDCKILYIVADDNIPIKSSSQILYFVQTIDANGADENMKVKLDANIEHIAFNMISKNELEVKAILYFDAIVAEKKSQEFIVDIVESDDIDYMIYPSMIIYFVKTGDTLWNVSKRYNTTSKQIAELNDIDNANLIYPGQKLIILKNTNIA